MPFNIPLNSLKKSLKLIFQAFIKRKILLFSLLFLLVTLPIVFLVIKYRTPIEAAWFDDTFTYRKAVAIPSHTALETNVYVTVPTFDATDTSKFQADCGDLRFTKQNGEQLPYYVMDCDATANIHVQFDSLPAGATTYYMYYGNPSVQNGFSATDFSTAATGLGTQTLATEEKSAGPVAYWKFDEGYGTNVYNSSAQGSTGSFSGSPVWKSEDQCVSGKCIYFNGTDAHTQVNETYSLKQNNSWSISTWIKPFTTSAYDKIVVGKQGWHGGLLWYNSTVAFYIRTDVGSSFSISHTPVTGQWTYYVATYETGTGIMKLYANGQFVNQTTFSGTMLNYGDSLFIGGSGTASYHSNVAVDDIKIYPYARSAAQIKADFNSRGSASPKGAGAALGADSRSSAAFSNGLVGYWKMDESSWGSVLDSSGNSNNGTAVNGASITSGKFGNGGNFVSSSSQDVSVTSSTSLSPTTGITIVMWVNTSGNSEIFQKSGAYGAKIVGNKFTGYRWGGPENHYSTTSISSGWNFLVATYDGQAHKTYVNGNLEATESDAASVSSNSNPLYIGGNGSSSYINGKIDEVRVYNRALSSKEVRDLYAWAPGPLAYYNFDEGTGTAVNDISGNGRNGSLVGSPQWTPGKFGKGMRITTTGQYATVTGLGNYVPAQEITVEYWAKPDTVNGYQNAFWIGTDSPDRINVHYYWSGTQYWDFGTCCTPRIALDPGIVAGRWDHFAYVSSIQGNYMRIYKNGVQIGSNTAPGTFTPANYPLYIGNQPSGSYPLLGTIDEFKIYNYARTSKQIVEDMNAGHPLGGSPVGSQVSYWKLDEGYGTLAYDSMGRNNGTLTSSPVWSNQGKFNKALLFNGNSGYVNVGDPADGSLDFNASQSFSVTFWIKTASHTSWMLPIWKGGSSLGAQGYDFEIATNGRIDYNHSDTVVYKQVQATSYNVADDQWHHIAGVTDRTANRMYLYIDGKRVNSGTDISTLGSLASANIFYVRYPSYNINGIIDEVKVYSSALTEDEIKLDYNRGSAMVLGTLSDTSGLTGGSIASSSASAAYCVPGDTATCSPPVGEWNFEEGSGASAQDSSGGGSTGTITGATYQAGKIGKALNFNAGTDAVTVSNSLSTKTVEFWVYPSTTTQNLIDLRTDATAANISVSSGTISATGFTSPTIYVNGKVSSTLSAGAWQHVTITTGTAITANAIRFGRIGSTSLTGKLDLIRIFDYARTPAQIAWDYNRGGPVGWWKMDECQGIAANDSSGNNHSLNISIGATGTNSSVGTCTGSAGEAWKDGSVGKYNSSLEFDGTDDYVKVNDPSDNALDPTSEYSLSTWVKYTATTGYGFIISKTSGGSGGGYELFRDTSTGKIRFSSCDNVGSCAGGYFDIITDNSYNDGNWHHIAAIAKTNDTAKIYIDGILVKQSGTVTQNNIQNALNLYVGARGQGSGSSFFSGQIDDVKIFNYALTATQIKTLYNQNSGIRFGPSTGSP